MRAAEYRRMAATATLAGSGDALLRVERRDERFGSGNAGLIAVIRRRLIPAASALQAVTALFNARFGNGLVFFHAWTLRRELHDATNSEAREIILSMQRLSNCLKENVAEGSPSPHLICYRERA